MERNGITVFPYVEVEDDEAGCRERNKEDTQQGNVWPPKA